MHRPKAMALVAAAALSCGAGRAAIETSPLFEKVDDPVSGVVSYSLKYGAPDDNRQSIYFTAKSITDDGRYLVFWYTKGNETKGIDGVRMTMLADLETGKVTPLSPRDDMVIPFVETKENYLVYGSPAADGFWRVNFADPEHPVKLCDRPKALEDSGKPVRYYTHLTLTRDRRKAFLDAVVESPDGIFTPANTDVKRRFVQGLLTLETGDFELWGETPFLCNHGQINPARDDLAMAAWEYCWRGEGKKFRAETGVYPRMWFFEKGRRSLVAPAEGMSASHEMWDDDGRGHYWCGTGVWHRDLSTGKIECWSDQTAAHANASPDNKYLVYDHATNGKSWRGCGWIVTFFNRETLKRVDIYSAREPLNPKDRPSTLHPDPHPHFVMNGRYVVSTACNGDGHMDLYVTPVEQLVAMTAAGATDRAEAELAAKLPEIFARSADLYKTLDTTVARISADAGTPRLPHTFDTGKREVVCTVPTAWTSGFFPGSLWYLYEATGEEFFKDRALLWTETLEQNKTYDGSHDTGFKIMCSYGNARRILGEGRYDAVILQSAGTLSTRFYEPLGLIRSWGKMGNMREFLVIPDNLMNLELLETASKMEGGEARFDRIARSHADVTMKHHFRQDGGVYHVLDYEPKTGRVQKIKRGQGASCDTAWARGQAWAIYGYTMMFRETGDEKYLAQARKAADFALNNPNMPADAIPYWDYGAPGEERDSSAGAVMASALLELSTYAAGEEGARYRAFAVKQLLSLASPEYFSQGDEAGGFLLKHATGHKPAGQNMDVPLCYADYYFLEALLRFKKLQETGD